MFSIFKRTPAPVSFEWLGTDIHSHLLPGIDDGSPDLVTSMRFFAELQELGFTRFICTPHIFKELYPNTVASISPALEKVLNHQEIKKSGIDILAAAEYMIDPDFKTIFKDDELMLFPGNYILVEMPFLSEAHDIENIIFNICLKGYKPILAHPERYLYYMNNHKRLVRLQDMGCRLQLNLLSVTGYYGKEIKEFSLKLLKDGLYELAGTDFHHERHLEVFKDARAWMKVIDKLKEYPFKNKEFFG